MRKLYSILIFICTINSFGYSQEKVERADGWIFGPAIGYQYQRGSFLKASAWTLFAPNQSQYIKFDAGANFTWMKDQSTVIPEFGITYYLNNVAVWPFVKGEITPYTATAKGGISVFSILELSAGYGFDINTKKNFKPIDGFTFGVGINFPLKFHLF